MMKKHFRLIALLLVILLLISALVGCGKKETQVDVDSTVDDYTTAYSSYVGQIESYVGVVSSFAVDGNVSDEIYVEQVLGSVLKGEEAATYMQEMKADEKYKGAQKLFNQASEKLIEGFTLWESALKNTSASDYAANTQNGLSLLKEGVALMNSAVATAQEVTN